MDAYIPPATAISYQPPTPPAKPLPKPLPNDKPDTNQTYVEGKPIQEHENHDDHV